MLRPLYTSLGPENGDGNKAMNGVCLLEALLLQRTSPRPVESFGAFTHCQPNMKERLTARQGIR